MGIPPSPTTRPPSAPNPSLLCSPQKDGAPVGPRGRAGCPRASCCAGAWGQGLGKLVSPPTPPLPVPYILERHPPWRLSPRGTMVCTFISPQSGTAGGALQQAPRRTAVLDGGGSGGEGAITSGPLRLHRGPPSAEHFPLSRSKNTKLGTPGTPTPAPLPHSHPHPRVAILGVARREC